MLARSILVFAIASATLGLGVSIRPAEPEAMPFFLDPAFYSASVCSGAQGPQATRQMFLSAASAYAQTPVALAPQHALSDATLARLSYRVTTGSDEAQRWFDHGLAYTFGFNHAEATRAYRRAQVLDPDCAMCFWGEAYALGGNINAGMSPEAGPQALEAIGRAAALGGRTPQETALIEALSVRYVRTPEGDIADDRTAFAEAMDAVARDFPDDDFIAVLAAEANMTAQAWNYWEADARTPRGSTARTIELLETVLQRSPGYAPAIHLYITSPRPRPIPTAPNPMPTGWPR